MAMKKKKKKKTNNLHRVGTMILLLKESSNFLDSMNSGCECLDIGYRCMYCLKDAIGRLLKYEEEKT